MAASELAKKGRSKIRFMIIPILLTVTTMLGACLWVIRKKKKRTDVKIAGIKRLLYLDDDGDFGNGDKDAELPLFDFSTLATATNGFSADSKLGEGGFGAVYKNLNSVHFQLLCTIFLSMSFELRLDLGGSTG
ncbi:hypothetical protein ACET3Z_010170 [Daucus carota]